jgi:hypothetical protein
MRIKTSELARETMPIKVQVYEGDTLVDTFSCHESATAFIKGEYSGAEADMLDVHVVEVEIPKELLT